MRRRILGAAGAVIVGFVLQGAACAFQAAWAQRWIEPISPIPDSDVRVTFLPGSAILTEAAKVVLDRQAAILLRYGQEKAVLYGHADPREAGSRQAAWDLGLARAVAARDYLIAKGVPSDRLRPDSRGRDFILMVHEPTEAVLAAMRIVSTEVVERPGHWSNRGY